MCRVERRGLTTGRHQAQKNIFLKMHISVEKGKAPKGNRGHSTKVFECQAEEFTFNLATVDL